MQRHATLVTLRDVGKQKGMRRLTIGIDLGDRRSHFCVLNDQGQVIDRGFLPTTISASTRPLLRLRRGPLSLENRFRIFSSFRTTAGDKLCVVTEADRSITIM